MSIDPTSEEYRQEVFEVVSVRLSQAFHQHVTWKLTSVETGEWLARALVAQVEIKFARTKKWDDRRTVMWGTFPRSWWQLFKKQVFITKYWLGWLQDIFPVQDDDPFYLAIEETTYQMCPHLPTEPMGKHVDFLSASTCKEVPRMEIPTPESLSQAYAGPAAKGFWPNGTLPEYLYRDNDHPLLKIRSEQ